ncbi:MAG: hypothetical protein KJP18_10440 [Gemmatimonadetes bacterium]|nr:hypothetical protein [Gemmatimonadota bacterium]NNK64742.1 hypothetical protein [Gemmatimonadota bacterium]
MKLFVRSAVPSRATVRRASLPLIAVLLASTSGCYKYLPAQTDPAPPTGETVRLVVTREGATDLAAITDLNTSIPRIEGRLESQEGGSFMVRVPQGAVENGVFSDIGQVLRVPTSQILSVEIRKLDPVMTGLLVGAVGAGSTLLLLKIIDSVGGGVGRDNPDPVLQMRIPFGFGFGRSR